MNRAVTPRRTVLGWQRAPGAQDDEPLIPTDATEIEIKISTEWLEALGWNRVRPELSLSLDEDGIHIQPAHPQEPEPRRVIVGHASADAGEG